MLAFRSANVRFNFIGNVTHREICRVNISPTRVGCRGLQLKIYLQRTPRSLFSSSLSSRPPLQATALLPTFFSWNPAFLTAAVWHSRLPLLSLPSLLPGHLRRDLIFVAYLLLHTQHSTTCLTNSPLCYAPLCTAAGPFRRSEEVLSVLIPSSTSSIPRTGRGAAAVGVQHLHKRYGGFPGISQVWGPLALLKSTAGTACSRKAGPVRSSGPTLQKRFSVLSISTCTAAQGQPVFPNNTVQHGDQGHGGAPSSTPCLVEGQQPTNRCSQEETCG